MRIMTYNVQSGRDAWGQLRLDGAAETIRRLSPDICGLNEIRVNCTDSQNVDQAAYLGEKTSMNYRFARAIPMAGGEYGIALLSRYPIVSFNVHPVPDVPKSEREAGYYENRVIYRAEVEAPNGNVAVYGTHFGLTRPERAYAVKLLEELIENEKLPLIFMGDLNMQPDDELIKRIEGKLTNLHKPVPDYTHHTLNLNMCIDYIFTRGIIATPARAVYSFASDHLPLLCEGEIE